MAINAYVIVDGISGPSTSKQNAIDILSFSFGASNTAVIGAGSSGGETRAGRAHIQDLTIMKVLDKTSPLMFDHCVSGDLIKSVELDYDKPMGNKQECYFKIIMSDVLVTSIQESGSSENPTEAITFAFAKVKVSYNPEKDGKLAGFVEKGWDLQKLTTF